MAIRWRPLTIGETDFRDIPWAGRLNGDTIDTSALAVICGTLTVEVTGQSDDRITVKVSGGRECERVTLTSTVTTAGGKTLVESIEIDVLPVGASPEGSSTASKRRVIDRAYEAAGLSGYTFDQTPEERFAALRALDDLMAQWEAEGLPLGYNTPSGDGEGDEDDASGIPDWALRAVSLQLAREIVAGIGKSLSREAEANRMGAISALRSRALRISECQLPGLSARAMRRRGRC